jgi:hypothetical protein
LTAGSGRKLADAVRECDPPAAAFRAVRARFLLSHDARGALLPDARWTFWTLTLWDSAEAMRAYMTGGAHRKAMPKLAGWCDEASVVHWDQTDPALPAWPEAERRMRHEGRPSKVRYPSAAHASLDFAALGRRAGVAIRAKPSSS